jgi:hypothetical protein
MGSAREYSLQIGAVVVGGALEGVEDIVIVSGGRGRGRCCLRLLVWLPCLRMRGLPRLPVPLPIDSLALININIV